MTRALWIGLTLLLAFTACRRDILVSKKWEWKNHQWASEDVKSLNLEATDTTSFYRLDLKIEHKPTYGFQNFYIRTVTTFPSGKEVSSITSLELANTDGTWAGDCRGKTCSISLPLQQKFTFPEIGKYKWSIEPYMRMDTVPGIKTLTVTCRKILK